LALLAEQFPKFENMLEAQLWRARALLQRKDSRAARPLLEAVVAADKGMLGAQARLSLGDLALSEGDATGALSAFLKVAVLYSDVELVAQANWGAGQAFESTGELDKARQSYREVLSKAPNSSQARTARARLSALGTP
jgi:TolA-binding protein